MSNRIRQSVMAVPQDLQQVDASVRRIGTTQRELAVLATEQENDIEAIKQEYARRRKPLEERLQTLSDGVFAFAQSRRAELIENERNRSKTVRLPSGGTLSWRVTPYKVSLRGADAVLKLLKARKLDRFIRSKEEVNKDAMTATEQSRQEAQTLKGVTISQHEELAIKPGGGDVVPVAVNKTAKRLKLAA